MANEPYANAGNTNNGNGSGRQPYTPQASQPTQQWEPQQTTSFSPVPPEPAPKERKQGSGAGKSLAIGLAGGVVGCAVVLAIAFGTGLLSTGGTTIGSTTSTPITAEDASETLANQVAEKAGPSVAAVDVYTEQGGWYSMFGSGGSSSSELVQSSLGSGVVLSEDGYVITNYHVVEGGAAYRVTVDGETYDAELVGSDASSDIAVLKLEGASGLTPIEIGDWVMTIGSPYGLEQSFATGIVSNTNRSQVMSSETDGSTTYYTNMIQTDAAINPGNSGGALVDDQGRLIGINTLIKSSSGSYSGVGFAIPVNYAVSLAQQIIDGETPTHAQLGVRVVPVTSSNAQMYNLSVDSGAYVSSVDAGSGAEAGGIEAGDIITALDGEKVESAIDLTLAVRSHNPGDTVTVTVNRNGETVELEVTLGEDEDQTGAETQQESSDMSWGDIIDRLYGGGSGGYGYGYGNEGGNSQRSAA